MRSPPSSSSPTGGSPTARTRTATAWRPRSPRPVHDTGSLADYVRCRLWTSGRTDAAARRARRRGRGPPMRSTPPGACAPRAPRPGRAALPRSVARPHRGRSVPAADRARRPTAAGPAGRVRAARPAVGCDPREAALASAHGTAASSARPGCDCCRSTRSTSPPSCTTCVRGRRRGRLHDRARRRGRPPPRLHPFAEIDVELQAALPTRSSAADTRAPNHHRPASHRTTRTPVPTSIPAPPTTTPRRDRRDGALRVGIGGPVAPARPRSLPRCAASVATNCASAW